jgi:hypothetical protein
MPYGFHEDKSRYEIPEGMDMADATGILSIANGGTGADNADAARANLHAAGLEIATPSRPGLMSAYDKQQLNRLASGAGMFMGAAAGFGYQNASGEWWIYVPVRAAGKQKAKVTHISGVSASVGGYNVSINSMLPAGGLECRIVNGGSLLELHLSGAVSGAGARHAAFVWMSSITINYV